ncbi:FKBP-type peptidyl-prolyl cis-trans isomerase [Blastococcus sp. TBT05-19]|uniref:FKBP-type peptidyl-prolyl cis-trans isomerase n=1 Tax=Blastococcus sp. TBT05-19 TaxID=2250581 RepID=UPI000DEBD0F0|nr:FKBP-type peptidyl-prolyl cis-trans isomerase [Blastococcus sp. TBT05-19]RBY94060.1 FKBP-type peptidyl-prolyl cis-trans isomerase [Blastococcus sp. TBT05-19]
MTRRTVPGALLALSLLLPLSACGEGEGSSSGSGSGSGSASSSGEITTDLQTAPEVPASDEEPPTELVIEDVVVGDGAEAEVGSTVAVKYVGAFYETGEEFDSSWSRGNDETLPVQLGSGMVIEGFDQGITGMKEGGRRSVTIPSELGYGPRGQGPIPGDATLVFVIDLVEVGS